MTGGRKPASRPRKRGPAPGPPSKGALRVVAGEARGRRLDVPTGTTTRPTSDRVREAVFNALDSLGAVEGAIAIDAFAGSGALGIEALSRGAAHVTFVEVDAAARAVIAGNLAATGLAERATVTGGDGPRAASVGPWDLVLLDPPYAFEHWDQVLADLVGALAADAVVVVESDREVALPAGLVGIRTKQYGGTVVTFASPTGAPS
ncbi:MAG: putative ribosomal methyltransferase [Acidimicrobiales bacterium]|nr:putative ribosomal methyltransferase [Acidimicrobiales bacterium]